MAIGAEIKLGSRECCYPLCPMQEGMLFHALRTRESGVDICQVIVDCPEELDGAVMERAWQQLAERQAVLRTSFRWEGLSEPLQEVHAHARIPVTHKDWGWPASEQDARLEELLQEERRQGFELAVAPLMRVVLIRRGPGGEGPLLGGRSTVV